MVPTECFPVVPLPRKSRRVSFFSDVEVMVSPSTFPSPGLYRILLIDHYRQASLLPSVPDADSNHGQDVFVIVPPPYVLFPFADPLMMRTCC